MIGRWLVSFIFSFQRKLLDLKKKKSCPGPGRAIVHDSTIASPMRHLKKSDIIRTRLDDDVIGQGRRQGKKKQVATTTTK